MDDTCRLETMLGQIVGYLRENPRATDTLDGIHDWWLSDQYRHCPRELTRQAIDLLISRGVVRRMRLAGSVWVYAAADDHGVS